MKGRADWAPDGYVAYSKMCTHLGCPVGLYEQELELLVCPCHQSMFNVRDGAVPAVRPGPPPAAPAAPLHRPAGLPPGPGRVRPAGRARASGTAQAHPSRTATASSAAKPRTRREAKQARPLRPGPGGHRRARRPPGRGQGRPDLPGQDLPGPLVVHAGRDRPVLLRGPAGHRRLPDPVLRALARPRSSTTASTSPWTACGCPRPTPPRSNLSFAVRGGLLMRQMHHWAADIFIGSIVVHMARIFFTGAFRKPRELNWIIGITLLILAILNGFIGYSLPDDLVSGTGLRIAYSILLSIPFVGTYLAYFLFGGNFPGHSHHRALLHHPRADHPAGHPGAARRPPRACWCARSTPSSPARAGPSTTWSARRCSRPSWPRPPASCSW